ncbi:MAG: chemotaxis protein CheA [Myxococcota bacterium]
MSEHRDALLEELASEALAAQVEDADSLEQLRAGLDALKRSDTEGEGPGWERELCDACGALDRLLGGGTAAPDAELERVVEGIRGLQARALSVGEPDADARREAAAAGRFEPPEWVDEEIFRDFLSAQRLEQEELEADILALEARGEDALASLRRRLHTLKGEAGTLGLDVLEGFCHQLEDELEGLSGTPAGIDRLLVARDWMGRALESYGAGVQPDPSPELGGPVEPAGEPAVPEWVGDVDPATESLPREGVAGAPETRVPAERDDETVSLLSDFLQEGGDGLDEVDRLLMEAEPGGLDGDTLNAVFRVFHTLKGIAGFLELADITELAHTTETLLDRGRQGKLQLSGGVVDVVFDATEKMRSMLEGVRCAVEGGNPFPATADLDVLLGRVRAASEGGAQPEAVTPQVSPGARIGEILEETADVDPVEVADAARAQSETGRRLGEELAARHVAKPRQIAQALRAQERSRSQARIRETVKVDLERVDRLVETIGELVVVESMVTNVPEVASSESLRLRNSLGQLSKITRDLQDMAMGMRTVPVRGLFQKMARMVRDLCHRSGKQVEFKLSGEGTEMDRSMVEHLADPLVHMIRNAVDHGVEPAADRRKAGKSVVGRVELSAYHEGGGIVIELEDDGRGLDRGAILSKAIEQGLVEKDVNLSDSEIFALIFAPGFSTAKEVTEISGRGVGMDVVRRNIESMRGRVSIESETGKGSTFRIVLPLTLAIIDGMLVACGKERYIVPTLSIVESFQPSSEMLASCADSFELIHQRGETIPLLRMDDLFGIQGAERDPISALVVVVESLGQKLGLLVDDVVTQQQVVIKSLGTGLEGVGFVAGGAILSDGQVGLILNVDELGRMTGSEAQA